METILYAIFWFFFALAIAAILFAAGLLAEETPEAPREDEADIASHNQGATWFDRGVFDRED